MVNQIFSHYTASISDFQQDPLAVIEDANGETIAVLDHNKPAFYCIPTPLYEQLLEMLEDQKWLKIAQERSTEPTVKISIEELRERVKANAV
ncbi:type II toxin-antitoxin system Phd/YefM family antitoxin [Ursidibacter arcticus]